MTCTRTAWTAWTALGSLRWPLWCPRRWYLSKLNRRAPSKLQDKLTVSGCGKIFRTFEISTSTRTDQSELPRALLPHAALEGGGQRSTVGRMGHATVLSL